VNKKSFGYTAFMSVASLYCTTAHFQIISEATTLLEG